MATEHVSSSEGETEMKVLVPDNLGFIPEAGGWTVTLFDALDELPISAADADALVVFETPGALLQHYAQTLKNLRWVQSLGAGVDAMFAAGFRPGTLITSGRGLHDRPVAEHVLALLLSAARSLPTAFRAQIGHRWAGELGGRQDLPGPRRFTSLIDAHIAIWGYGSIGHHLAEQLHHLGARTTGIVRHDTTEADVVHVRELDRLLPQVDALVSLLPSTSATTRLIDERVFAGLPAHAWFVSAGRGSAVDQAALTSALRSGEIAGAALDVFEEEPLPIDSPLWDLPNVVVTPHAAGGRPLGSKKLIEQNLRSFASGRELANLVGTVG